MSVITAAERTVTRARIEARERPGIAATTVKRVARWSAAEWFIVLQTALPALLFLPGTQAIRLPLRIAPFAISLALLAHWVFAGGLSERLHPARRWLTAIVILLALMLGHPFTNTAMSAIAQVFLYISVLGPAFWLPRNIRDTEHARRLLVLMLLCNGSNAVVGVLQAYDPARFMPAELSARVLNSTYGLSTVSYVISGKRPVSEPMRERVLAAVEELDYRPHGPARALASRSSPSTDSTDRLSDELSSASRIRVSFSSRCRSSS